MGLQCSYAQLLFVQTESENCHFLFRDIAYFGSVMFKFQHENKFNAAKQQPFAKGTAEAPPPCLPKGREKIG